MLEMNETTANKTWKDFRKPRGVLFKATLKKKLQNKTDSLEVTCKATRDGSILLEHCQDPKVANNKPLPELLLLPVLEIAW